MTTKDIYEFSVQIFDDDGVIKYGIYQEFPGEEVELIEGGEADSLEQAAALAADGIRRAF